MNQKLVIFDLAGTIVDFGCLAVKNGFKVFLKKNKIIASDSTITKYTGVSKKEHLKLILKDPECQHRIRLSDKTINKLYGDFQLSLLNHIRENSDLIPGAMDVYEHLKQKGYKIATTTGYYRRASDLVLELIKKQGFKPDCSLCNDDVKAGRPAPWMIFECMKILNVQCVQDVVKVGDTVVDMLAAKNAGVWSVGIMDSSSLTGLSKQELYNLKNNDPRNHTVLLNNTYDLLKRHGEASIVYDSLIDTIKKDFDIFRLT